MENNKKIEGLLTMILLSTLKEANIGEKAEKLTIVGFSQIEIAHFLGTTPATVKQLLYVGRKAKNKKK